MKQKKVLAAATVALFSVNSVWACLGGAVKLDVSKMGFPFQKMVVTASGVGILSGKGEYVQDIFYDGATHGLKRRLEEKGADGNFKIGEFDTKWSKAKKDVDSKNPPTRQFYKPRQNANETKEVGAVIVHDGWESTVVPTGEGSGGMVYTNSLHVYDPKRKDPEIRIEIGESGNRIFTKVILVKGGKDMKSFFVTNAKNVRAAAGGEGSTEFDPAITQAEGQVEVKGCGEKVTNTGTDSNRTGTDTGGDAGGL